MPLEWSLKGQFCIASDCGRYHISKGLVHGTPWWLVHHKREIIGQRHDSPESAIEAAERHATHAELHAS